MQILMCTIRNKREENVHTGTLAVHMANMIKLRKLQLAKMNQVTAHVIQVRPIVVIVIPIVQYLHVYPPHIYTGSR